MTDYFAQVQQSVEYMLVEPVRLFVICGVIVLASLFFVFVILPILIQFLEAILPKGNGRSFG